MSENERESGNGRSSSGEGDDRRNRVTVFGKDLSAAYAWAIGALGAVGAAVPIMALFVKSPTMVLVGSICFVVGVVLIVATLRGMARAAGHRVPMTVGVLVAVLVVALGAGAAIGMELKNKNNNSGDGDPKPKPTPSSAPSTSTPAATTPSPVASPCPKPLTITSPMPDATIVGHTGVVVGISACDLPAGDQGWLFDVDGGDGSFGRDGDGAIVTGDGTSTFTDTPVGQQGDVKAPVKLTLVLANAECAKQLETIDWDNNQPSSLPQPCVIESQVEVYETY